MAYGIVNSLGVTMADIDDIKDIASEKAPTNHASSDTTYGVGTDLNYGHVKLSDSTSANSSTGNGIAATPKAVKAVYDLANTALRPLQSCELKFTTSNVAGWYKLLELVSHSENALIKLHAIGSWEETLWIFIASDFFSDKSPTINIIGNTYNTKITKFRCNCSTSGSTGSYSFDAYITPTHDTHQLIITLYEGNINAVTIPTTPTLSTTATERAVVNHSAPCGFESSVSSWMTTDFSNSSTTLPIAKGGTGATTADDAKNNLGLGTSSWVKFGKTVSESFEVVSEYPYIDFSPNSQTDFEVRIAKNAANQLNIEAPNGNATLKVNGANVQTQGHIHLAGQGLYNGYSFQNEIGNDTGMFSTGDGDLQFYSNTNKLMYTLDNRLVFPNGTVYVQESQPSAPDGSLWAW